jgi:carbohydrate-binding DOMON domain-containing protein
MNKIFIDNIIVMLLYVIIQKKIKIFMDKTIVIDFYLKTIVLEVLIKKYNNYGPTTARHFSLNSSPRQ